MAQAASISLSKFTETVQAAVKVAMQKHPKFKLEHPTQLRIDGFSRTMLTERTNGPSSRSRTCDRPGPRPIRLLECTSCLDIPED
jgi:hypothetical protein